MDHRIIHYITGQSSEKNKIKKNFDDLPFSWNKGFFDTEFLVSQKGSTYNLLLIWMFIQVPLERLKNPSGHIPIAYLYGCHKYESAESGIVCQYVLYNIFSSNCNFV